MHNSFARRWVLDAASAAEAGTAFVGCVDPLASSPVGYLREIPSFFGLPAGRGSIRETFELRKKGRPWVEGDFWLFKYLHRAMRKRARLQPNRTGLFAINHGHATTAAPKRADR